MEVVGLVIKGWTIGSGKSGDMTDGLNVMYRVLRTCVVAYYILYILCNITTNVTCTFVTLIAR